METSPTLRASAGVKQGTIWLAEFVRAQRRNRPPRQLTPQVVASLLG